MAFRSTAWAYLIGGALAIAATASLAAAFLTDTAGALRTLAAFAGVLTALTAIAFWGWLRARRRALAGLIEAVRRGSAGEPPVSAEFSRAGELLPLAAALRSLEGRLRDRLELLDGRCRAFETLLDRLQDGIIVADPDGRIVLMNPAAAQMLNSPVAPERWSASAIETCIPQHAVQRLLWDRRRGDADYDAHNQPIRLEIERPQGTVHLLAWADDIKLAPAPGSATEGCGRVVMLTDVTALERLSRMKTDFVANASHELRTPLATIRAGVETLLGMDLRAEEAAARSFLEKIDRHSARLEMLVRDLLDLSRLEAPTTCLEPERIDAARLLDDLYSRFVDRLERKRLRWEADLSPDLVQPLVANPLLLRLVLDNLVDNAIKFTDAGGRVCISVKSRDGEAVFEVRDTGCGIPPEEQERVFERFYQVERARSGSERGTGLGLAIVRHAVGGMQGTVQLTSAVGAGTTVTVRIPQKESA